MRRVLIIKTSSLGDIIHTLPALSDAKKALPDIEFDWVVEEAFAEVPSWHPAVSRVIPIALRRWRKRPIRTLLSREFWHAMKLLREQKYDVVLDSQGLIKSACIAWFAHGRRVGLDKASLTEPFARFVYQSTVSVDLARHAIWRMRTIFAKALGYEFNETEMNVELSLPTTAHAHHDYILFLHGTTWATKRWPNEHWVALSKLITDAGLKVKVPWANRHEQLQITEWANENSAIEVLPKSSLTEMASIIRDAKAIVAVDTGLGHLADLLNVPTISLYGPTDPKRVGTIGKNQTHIIASLPCIPCDQHRCKISDDDHKAVCMHAITPEIVFEKIFRDPGLCRDDSGVRLAIAIFKFFPYGGVERDCLRIVKALLAHGYQIDLYTMQWQGEKFPGINIHLLPATGWTNHARAVSFSKQIQKLHDSGKYQAVIGFNKMAGLDLCFVGDRCFKMRARGIKKLLPRYRQFAALEKAVFASGSKTEVMLLTPQQKAEYQAVYQTPDERITLLPPGLTYYPPADKMPHEKIQLLFVASKFYNKGLDRAIRSLAALNRPTVELLVVGHDDKKRYQALAKKRGVVEQVKFLGAIDSLHQVMVNVDVCIHPARVEAAGMVLLEALIAGLPVLTTAACGYAFHINNAGAGIVLSEPFSQQACDEALKQMIDQLHGAQFRENALQYAQEADLYEMGERAVDVLKKVLS